jgi:hypothetical protein
MEKIWIQFNDTDYQVYHKYCLRYYTINDATRKRSIHLFLELFEKDMLPVEEHDLNDVFLFFSKKCDEAYADHNLFGKINPSADLPRLEVCGDLLSLIADFEKIYRLIQKTGVVPNYLLVLATFSKIIEDERNAYISAVNEQDRKKIELSVPGITEIIRTRLGPDAGWEAVLYELTRVVRMFNQASPHQKIDRNCIFLLGSAVVSQFNAEIGPGEIQSTLERYFEESELAEFESLLDTTPSLPDDDPDYDVNDYVIFEALKSISTRDSDTEHPKTVSDPGYTSIAGILPVIPRNSEAITRSKQTFPPSFVKRQEKYSGRFDVNVSDTSKSLVLSAEKRTHPLSTVHMKPAMLQYSILSMALIIFILFAITIGPASGIWNPAKSISNTSTGVPGNGSNPVDLQNNSSLSAKNNPVTAVVAKKTTAVQSLTSRTAVPSAGTNTGTVQPIVNKTAVSPEDAKTLFMSIAFGPNNAVIKKSAVNRISLSISGDCDDNDIATIEQFKAQFNNDSYTNKFTWNKNTQMATINVMFLPESSLENVENSDIDTVISKDPDTGVINYMQSTVTTPYSTVETLYINSDFTGDERTHWTLRGLLSELGFWGGTTDYTDSIFYSGSDTTAQLSANDWKAVTLMYGSKITPGMSFDRVKSLLMI